MEDKESPGRPSSLDDDVLRALLEENPITTFQETRYKQIDDHLKAIRKVKNLESSVPYS